MFEEGAEAGLEEPGLLRASGGRVRWIVSSLGSRREGEREGGRENTGESQREEEEESGKQREGYDDGGGGVGQREAEGRDGSKELWREGERDRCSERKSRTGERGGKGQERRVEERQQTWRAGQGRPLPAECSARLWGPERLLQNKGLGHFQTLMSI